MGTGTPSPQAPAAPLRLRRSAARLTAGQLALLRRAFTAAMGISDDRGYAYWAGIHGLPLPIGCDNAHGTPYFLPWHRAYLYFFERALRDQAPDVTLPWWNWTATFGGPRVRIPAAYTDRRGADGTPNPLLSAPVDKLALQQGRQEGMSVAARTARRPGAPGAPPLPTAQEVEDVLRLSDFLDFTAQLEGLHDRVHVWTGGHMGLIPFAAFDPIFWAHHTMVDRIWRLWQLRHAAARPPASILDQALPPFGMTVRQTLDVTALGYDYAVATSTIAGT
jgi:tyrosinase